jgi:hypothetical protein
VSDLLIGRSDYNVVPNATITASAADVDYPATYLTDGLLGRPAKLSTTTGSWVLDFGSAQRIDMVAFGPHNLTAGLAVQFQGHTSDSWGAPTLTTAVTIPTYREDGQSVNPWVDLTGVSGYSVSGFRYWRLNISGTNDAAIAIGELVAYSQKTTVRNFRVGVSDTDTSLVVSHETVYGVETVYSLGIVRRRLSGETYFTSAQLATFLSWYRGGNGHSDWHLVVLDDTVNDARFVRFDGDGVTFQRLGNGVHRAGLAMTEVSRGLRL